MTDHDKPVSMVERGNGLSAAQIGILRDVWANRVDLNTCGEWLRDQLCELTTMGREGLVDTLGDAVILTPEGLNALADAALTESK